MAAADQSDELIATILERYKDLESDCDFVVCEGTDYTGSVRRSSSSSTYAWPLTWARPCSSWPTG